MHNCPHCGEPGISTFRKLFLGPAVSTTCKVCGKKVSVSHRSILIMVPLLFIAVFIGTFVDSTAIKIVTILLLFIITTIAQLRWIPLERR